MQEKEIERYLCQQAKKRLGGLALKFVSPGLSGVPDRIVLMPGGKIAFVETKAPSKKLRTLQEYVCGMIAALGFEVRMIDTKRGVDAFILEMEAKL